MLTSIYIFDSLADPLYLIPEFITGLTESFVSLKRIGLNGFLMIVILVSVLH